MSDLFESRRAGLLLHPTSLPGKGETGNFGDDAYRFVDFLHAAGFSVWQTLPLGPVDSFG
jgi:4-alpha-glucanotransferase